MRLLLQSSRRFFRRHPGQLVLALAGMAAGVAVMTGVALMRDVLIESLDGAAEALAGRDSVRVTAAGGPLDESVFRALALAEGAPPLTPVLMQRVAFDGRRLELLGIDPFSGGGRGLLPPDLLGQLFESPIAAAANASTLARLDRAAGDPLTVRIGDRSLQLELVGPLPAGQALDDRLLMDIAALQDAVDRQGQLSWIDAPAEAREWLRARLRDSLQIDSAAQRRDAAARLTEGMRANLTAMGLISLAVGLFVIFSVLSFLLVQRRRSLAILRAVGVTSARVTAMLLLETAVVAGLGALIGLVLGTLLADSLVGLVRVPVAELYGLLAPAGVQPSAPLYAGVWIVAVGAALLSVSGLLREARRIPPGRILRLPPADSGQRLPSAIAAFGLLALAVVTVFASRSLPVAFAALFLALGGFALLAPELGVRLLSALRRIAPRRLPARALALLLAGQKRIRPALAALSLALALAVGLAMMVLGFRAAVDDWIDRLLRADSYVTASQGALAPATVDRIAGLPGIDTTSSARRVTVDDGRQLIAYDLPPRAWKGFEWLAGDSEAAYTAFRAGTAVVISEPLARRDRLEVGDELRLDTPAGSRPFRVAAVYRDYASERGTIALHAPLYRQLYDDRRRDSLGLYYDPATLDEAALAERLRAIDPDLQLTGREAVRETTLAVFDRTFRISWALAALVAVIAVIALVSALLALGLERRRDYATLRALGLTRGRLHALVVCQTAGLALAAALVAVPLSIAIHLGLSLVIQPRAFGWSLPLSWPLAPVAVMLPLALVCGLLAGLYPAWRIGRRDPAPELKEE
ncbi:MAG: FtsX-like permease family protein [Alphaproteobacteria bacterium]|jgi:putative ABC transport system permease protein|nr:FtsX-like permease family protein [Alphaproteobacteria bacterium]